MMTLLNNIAFDLGFIQIHWYSIFIFFALLLGGSLALNQGKKHGIDEDKLIDYFFWLIPISIICARVYYVLFNFDIYKDNLIDIIKIWQGGIAIHGALIGGFIYSIFYCKKHNLDILEICDILSLSVILGQAIGRWGNFFNQEAHGGIIQLETLKKIVPFQFIIDGMNIGGLYYHPTFLYESVWCIMGFIILFIFKNKFYKGQSFSFYLMWYSLGRFFIEVLRTDSLMFLNLRMAQIISVTLFILGLILFINITIKVKKILKGDTK